MTKETKRGRKNKYETHVKPRFDEIAEWARIGVLDKDIAANLGVNKATFCEYKNAYSELSKLLKDNRVSAVQEIKNALFKRATGYRYSEKSVIKEHGVVVRETINERYALPDPASAMILLKHWARDEGWTNDPAALDVRRKEVELKEKQIEAGIW